MNWYSVRFLFESKVSDSKEADPLCEQSIRIFSAKSEEEVLEKANRFGAGEEHGYLNENGDKVEWAFVRILEIQDLCESEIVDGLEVFSRLYRKDESLILDS